MRLHSIHAAKGSGMTLPQQFPGQICFLSESGNNGADSPGPRNPATGSSRPLSGSKMQPEAQGSTEVR